MSVKSIKTGLDALNAVTDSVKLSYPPERADLPEGMDVFDSFNGNRSVQRRLAETFQQRARDAQASLAMVLKAIGTGFLSWNAFETCKRELVASWERLQLTAYSLTNLFEWEVGGAEYSSRLEALRAPVYDLLETMNMKPQS